MIFLSWVAVYEGRSDEAYYDVLLPRLIDDITLREGLRPVTVPQMPALRVDVGRDVDNVAAQLCHNSDSYHLIFIHADTGGRGVETGMKARSTAYCRAVKARCNWPSDRCVIIGPRHETEAWVLADAEAVMSALGVTGDPSSRGLPQDAIAAEALSDPKAVLNSLMSGVSSRRLQGNYSALFARVAQEQRLEALRGSRSFQAFEAHLRRALASLGCLHHAA